MRLVRRTTGITPWGLVLLALCGLAIAPFASALPTPPLDSQRDLSASTFSSSLLEVAEDPPSPFQVVPAQSNRLFPRDEEDDEDDEDGAYPRTSYEVCVQVDIPICAPGLTASIGLAGTLESAYEDPSTKASAATAPSSTPGYRSVTAVLNAAAEGDLFLGKFYAIAEGEVTITSPNAVSHKDLISAFSRALFIRWFSSDNTIGAEALTALSATATEERKFVMQALESAADMRPGANGQLDAAQVDRAAAAFDLMRAAAEACVSAERNELLGILERSKEASTMGNEIVEFNFDKSTWTRRVEKYRGFGEPRKWWQFWGTKVEPPARNNWKTWSVLAAQAQHAILRFVSRADACVMDSVFGRNNNLPTHGDECANLPATRIVTLTDEIVALMSEEAKTILMSGTSSTALPASVTVYPALMCMMLRSAPDTEWLTDAAEEARMADADGQQTEADRAAADAARNRVSNRGGSGHDQSKLHSAHAAASRSTPLGEGHLWEGTTPGSTSDEQLHAVEACRKQLQKDGHAGRMEDGVLRLPPGLDSLPRECAIFATTGPSRELLDRDDDAREEGLFLGTATNGQRAEFVEQTLWSRTFPDINSMKNTPCSAEQLDPSSKASPRWCYVRISHASAELLFPIMRDLRFAFNGFAGRIRGAQESESADPSPLAYEKVAQYVHVFSLDVLRRYSAPGWTQSNLAERQALFVDGNAVGGAAAGDAAARVKQATHASSVPLAARSRRSSLFEMGKSSKNVLAPPSSLVELSGRIEAGTRLRGRLSASSESRMTISAAHRIGATHGGWLLDALADTAAALRARLERRADEMARMPFEITIQYATVLSLTLTAGTSSVGLCTPDTNMLQLRIAKGWEGQLKVTASTSPVSDEAPAVRTAEVELMNSRNSTAIEFTYFPTPYLGLSVMLSDTGAASKRAHHQGASLRTSAKDGPSQWIRLGLLVYLSMSDLAPTGTSPTWEFSDSMATVAGTLATNLVYATTAPFARLACRGNSTCMQGVLDQIARARSRASGSVVTSTTTTEQVDLGDDAVAQALSTGKTDKATKGRWKKLVRDAATAIAATTAWSHFSSSTDCSVAVLGVELAIPFAADWTSKIEVSSRLALRSQFAVPIGFKSAGKVTLHALRGVTYDLKDYVHKKISQDST